MNGHANHVIHGAKRPRGKRPRLGIQRPLILPGSPGIGEAETPIARLTAALEAAHARLRRLLAELQAVQAEKARLAADKARLEAENAKLQAEVSRLQAELEVAQRQAKRQSAPFSKGPPKEHPRRPGRKPGAGYGRKAHRPIPRPAQINEVYDVPLPKHCPHCGGHVKPKKTARQFQVEIPRQPIWRQFNVHIGTCQDCGRRVQGRHELQTSDALGAAASQLGPDAQAGIVLLNKVLGVSHGKIVQLYRDMFGIELSRGASAQVVLRAAEHCRRRKLEKAIQNRVRKSPWCVSDETGWRIGGQPAWLHVLVGDQATVYQIGTRRSADVAASVLGWDYAGTLIHDGLATYGRFHRAKHQQCTRHLMRRVRELLATAVGGSGRFPRQVLALFAEAFAVRDLFRKHKISRDDMAVAYLRLSTALQDLAERPRQNPANRRLAKHLMNHLREWFWFLLDPDIDATNYRAEQAIRPGVVNRKVWGGNRTPRGGRAQATDMSLLETCRRGRRNVMDVLHRLFCGSPIQLARPP